MNYHGLLSTFTPGSGRRIKEDGSYVNEADKLEEMLGGKGFEVIIDTAAHSPDSGVYIALQAIEEATIGSVTAEPTASITGSMAGITIPAGVTIYGRFTSVQLSAGKVIAYRGV